MWCIPHFHPQSQQSPQTVTFRNVLFFVMCPPCALCNIIFMFAQSVEEDQKEEYLSLELWKKDKFAVSCHYNCS